MIFCCVHLAAPPVENLHDLIAADFGEALQNCFAGWGNTTVQVDRDFRAVDKIAGDDPPLLGPLVFKIFLDRLPALPASERTSFFGWLRAARLNSLLLAAVRFVERGARDWEAFRDEQDWLPCCIIVEGDRVPTAQERTPFAKLRVLLKGPGHPETVTRVHPCSAASQVIRPNILVRDISMQKGPSWQQQRNRFNAMRSDASLFARAIHEPSWILAWLRRRTQQGHLGALLFEGQCIEDLIDNVVSWVKESENGRAWLAGSTLLLAARLRQPKPPWTVNSLRTELQNALHKSVEPFRKEGATLEVFALDDSDPTYDDDTRYYIVRKQDVPIVSERGAPVRLPGSGER